MPQAVQLIEKLSILQNGSFPGTLRNLKNIPKSNKNNYHVPQ